MFLRGRYSSDGIDQEFHDLTRPAKNQIVCRSNGLKIDWLSSFWWKFFVRCCYIWNKYNLWATVIQ